MSDTAPPGDVPVQPLPTKVNLIPVVASDGRKLLGLRFSTPQGAQIFFMDIDGAREIAERMRAECDGRAPLLIAGADQVLSA